MQLPAPQELLDLRGKVALITGAGSGIGSAIARRFAQAGAAVVVHYCRSRDGADKVVADIVKNRGRAVALGADLRFAPAAELLTSRTIKELGSLDILVNNAGTYPVTPLLDVTPEQWTDVIAANLSAVHFCTQAAARVMRDHVGGAIVNIASIEAHNPAAGHSHYTSAKSAVVMYTRTAARELGPYHIRVNCVSPGLIWKEGLEQAWPEGVRGYVRAAPLNRLGTGDDVADACLFLASTAARWITGADLVVDGGVLTNRVF